LINLEISKKRKHCFEFHTAKLWHIFHPSKLANSVQNKF